MVHLIFGMVIVMVMVIMLRKTNNHRLSWLIVLQLLIYCGQDCTKLSSSCARNNVNTCIPT